MAILKFVICLILQKYNPILMTFCLLTIMEHITKTQIRYSRQTSYYKIKSFISDNTIHIKNKKDDTEGHE